MEGKQAYILPAVAVVVLLVLFGLRHRSSDEGGPPVASAADPGAPPGPAGALGTKAKIRQAIAAAGDPTLGTEETASVRTSLRAVVDRCRAARPDSARVHVSVALEVIAAAGLGVRIERASVLGALPEDLVGCVREGMLGAKPADLGQTGRLTTTLEYGPP